VFQTIRAPMARRRVATTIFGTDNRRAFQDTAYPWSTVGLVQTNRGSGSGVMIGPRHLLTVSHVIDWTAPAGFAADWVRFTPSFFDGGAPFGESYGVHIFWYVQEDGDGFISGNEGNFDYVVVVLDRRLGETTGWMGARGYDDDWDDLDAWSHMGYPSDLNSGQRPTWQGVSESTAPTQPRNRSCTRPTCSLGSRVGRCSASGTGTWVHARSRSSPGS
jgi:V8-like Glu-specific endopeptidase